MKTLEKVVQSSYDNVFDWICKNIDDDLYDLVVEVKTRSGKTIRISWHDRECQIKEEEQK